MTLEKDPAAASPAAAHRSPLRFEDGPARWIEVPAGSRLRQPFDVEIPVARARLHITGQGLLRAELNGRAVNGDRLDPTRTDASRALSREYEVTGLVAAGRNALDVVAALGEWGRTGHAPRVLVELVLEHFDGTTTRIAPDEAALLAPSRVVVDEPFYLERHDPSADSTDWSAIPASAFLTADATDTARTPPLTVIADPTPPVRVVSRRPLPEIGRTDGARLYDVGTNIAGRSRVVLIDALPAGTVVRVVHGEHIGADGRLDTTNLTMPFDHGRVRQVVEWVATGDPGDEIEPWFAYHGFRYVEVQGLPDTARVAASAGLLHSDLAPVGHLRTDSPTITTLLERAERTFLNNQHGVPEDCPTREQSAWTGDTASIAEYAFSAFDVETYFGKWIDDLLTSQEPGGGLPAIAPDVRAERMPADPVWGAALHRLLLGHWHHIGDAEVVRRALPALRRWAGFQLGCADEHGVISRSPISYGHDWLALEQTPPEVHHTGATIDCLDTLAVLEEAAGDPAAADGWRRHAAHLRAGARARFFDGTRGVFANGSQGADAVAIDAGILVGAEREAAARRIEQRVRERGNRISGGFATTRSIVRALAATGRSQVVADMLAQPAQPGIGAMLVDGPGTFWECWWIDPTNTGTGSLDHVGLGGVFAGWAWWALAGVSPTAPGFRRVRIAPQFVTGVDRLDLRRRTPRGALGVAYEITGDTAELRVEIPHGTTASIEIEGEAPIVRGGGHHRIEVPVRRAPGIRPSPEPGWTTPSIAPAAADATGPRDLLDTAIAAGGVQPGADSGIHVDAGLNCMPIPHAQPRGPVVEVVSAEGAASAPTVRIDLARPVSTAGATFVYALVDLCDERWNSAARPVLRVIGADGSALRAVGTSWPAGWNRVAVDLDAWQDRGDIVAVEVSLCDDGDTVDPVMPQGSAGSPGGFHVGEVGVSTERRTW